MGLAVRLRRQAAQRGRRRRPSADGGVRASVAVRERAGFRWITIPDGLELAGDEVADPVRMTELYEPGYRNALAGQSWPPEPHGMLAWPPR
jgi:hypothetical protein